MLTDLPDLFNPDVSFLQNFVAQVPGGLDRIHSLINSAKLVQVQREYVYRQTRKAEILKKRQEAGDCNLLQSQQRYQMMLQQACYEYKICHKEAIFRDQLTTAVFLVFALNMCNDQFAIYQDLDNPYLNQYKGTSQNERLVRVKNVLDEFVELIKGFHGEASQTDTHSKTQVASCSFIDNADGENI